MSNNIRRLIHEQNFKLVSSLSTKVWSFKFIELDVCGRPFFANPVTYNTYVTRFAKRGLPHIQFANFDN